MKIYCGNTKDILFVDSYIKAYVISYILNPGLSPTARLYIHLISLYQKQTVLPISPSPLNSNPNSNPDTMNTPPTCKLNTIPNPPSPDPNAQSKSVPFTGVWQKKARQNETRMKTEKKKEERLRYAIEIAHHTISKPNRKIWLGTYNTPEEGAVAYDLAAINIKGKALNLSIGDNG